MTSNSDPEVLARAREQLAKTKTQVIDNVLYLTFANKDLSRVLQDVRKDELRPTDVISLGYPRSGNHWFFEIVEMLLQNNARYAEYAYVNRLLENRLIGFHEKIHELAVLKDPRLMVTHLRVTRSPRQIAEKNVKLVYIVRNPKDVMWSWFKLLTNHKHDRDKFHGSWEEFFELSLTGETPWGSWFDHVLDMETFIKDHPSVPVFIAQYEKFKFQPEQELRKLARFLGRPEDKIPEVAAAVDFQTMKLGTAAKMKQVADLHISQNNDGYFVKGSVHEWRKHFTVDMNERYDKEFEERMNGSAIADLVRKYII